MNNFYNIVCISYICIYLIYSIFIRCEFKKYQLMNIVLVLLIAAPGISLKGTLINYIDIISGIIFIYLIFTINKNKKLKVNLDMYLVMYGIIILLSIIGSFFMGNNEYFTTIFKSYRFIEIIIIYIFTLRYYNLNWIESTTKIVLISGIIGSSIGIINFFLRVPMQSEQYILINHELIYRAGGVYQEANSFANMMTFNIIFALIILLEKARIRKNIKILSIINIASSLVGLIVSFCRGPIVAILVTLIIMAIYYIKNNNLKLFKLLLIIAICCMFIINLNEEIAKLVEIFLNDRVLPLLSINGENINSISSGRIGIWSSLIENFFSLNWIVILLGTGYKASTIHLGFGNLSDNNYLGALVQTGILGFVVFIVLNYKIITNMIKYKTNNIYIKIYKDTVIFIWISNMIQMLTGDVITFYRNISLVFIFIAIVNKYFREKLNE